MNQQVKSFRNASLFGLLLSVPSLVVVCTLVTNVDFCIQISTAAWVQILAAFGGMISVVWLSSRGWAAACRRRFWLFGIYFVGLFWVGVLVGGVASMIRYQSLSAFDYVLKPFFWLSLFGVIPAFFLGVIAWGIMRKIAAVRNDPLPLV
jgi:hypothetical protein